MNCIIVDDELPAREELKYFIKNFSSMDILSEFEDGTEALKFLQANSVDIIFLDINIPGIDGINLAKILCKLNFSGKVIFITAYKEYALDAFDIHAFDYLLKPFSEERIISSLERIEDSRDEKLNNDRKSDKLSVMRNGKIYVVNTKDICYLEASGRTVKVCVNGEEYLSKHKISEIESKLSNKEFYKSHRSYIVNLGKVEEIKPWFNGTYVLKIKDIEKEVPVSRNKVKDFKRILSL
ncbi:LytR/AlgR family response regulator transcription factor [Clostridium septicum]|uniref:Stage 0 sporulation protein A homolog n=1 Tax=Clostridium septicum TaxID=1504 RepID=A0A9N7JJ70_CLOSE|nr:LytTR family DNA-binding domain-containing protein [Clostridium septicum]AYE33513.1 DNA-binding response regulator [Clostridium septicum]MDU1313786.1 LytTR family DNA-binding domain-containing protein [Clostridium septicum]QAS61679.1 response regulator transcription factor [Clostridium septicum]UEC21878.1 LytTR family DNA-binding domain-containing protein [Clostridium septicum]WLF68616.1 LytTR family DNA-binding domain-containing protein [Clostridium septicum]